MVKLEKGSEAKDVELSKKENEVADLQRKTKNMEEVKRICGVQQNKLEEQQQRIKGQQKNFDDGMNDLVNQIARLEG